MTKGGTPLLPDFESWLGSPPRHQDYIKAWVDSIADDPAGLCVLHNFFERETVNHNVPPAVFLDFFSSLGDLLAGGGDLIGDLTLIRKITDERPKRFYVQGSHRPKASIQCSRFISVDDFVTYYDQAGQLPVFLRGGRTTRDVIKLVRSGNVKAEKMKWSSDYKRPWWVVPTEDVAGCNGEQVRNLLGLSHCSRGALVELKYPPYFAKDNLAAPSVLDAGDHICFRPVVPTSGDGDYEWGRTVSLPDLRDGAREAVHEPPDELGAEWTLSVTSYIEGMPSVPDYQKILEVSQETC
jgi:hypothetical protein